MSDDASVPMSLSKVSARAAVVPAFEVMEVMNAAAARDAELEEMEAAERVVHLEVGQPAAGAPAAARAAAIAALSDGSDALGYTLACGEAPLRKGIAELYSSRRVCPETPVSILTGALHIFYCETSYGIQIGAENVAVTTGSSGAFVAAFTALFDADTRVACPVPGYPCYRNTLSALGVEVVALETHSHNGYAPTPAMLESEIAKSGPLTGIVLASPCNPTGAALSRECLIELARYCEKNNIKLVVDEIYHFLNLRGSRLPSALEISDSVIVISSFSKYWCLAGYRVGFLITRSAELMAVLERLLQNLHISAPTISQRVALASLSPASSAELDTHVERYASSIKLLVRHLPALGFEELREPDGAFYVYARCTALLARLGLVSSVNLCQEMLQKANVAATPGVDFDPIRGTQYVRFSVAGSTEDVVEAIGRLERWLTNSKIP